MAHYALHLSSVNNEQGQWLYSIADGTGTGKEGSFTARRETSADLLPLTVQCSR